MQLQSEGKVMTQTSRMMTVFCHDFSLSLLLTHSSTSPQASSGAPSIPRATAVSRNAGLAPEANHAHLSS